jgi:Ca2+-binding EF-hand superfamily protein
MAEELGWTENIKMEQMAAARQYISSYAGRIPDNKESILRGAKYQHVEDLFNAIDMDGSGFLDKTEVGELASILGIELTEEELTIAFKQMDQNGNDRVDLTEFESWLRNSQDSILYQRLTQELSLEELKKMGSGTLLG